METLTGTIHDLNVSSIKVFMEGWSEHWIETPRRAY